MTTQNVKEKMVYFNFEEIKTYINHQGLEKKKNEDDNGYCILPKGWQNITLETMKKYINNGPSVGLLTGKINGITVIDYDDKNKFNEDNEKFNFFKNGYHIVETNNGYHLYCKYDENIPTTTNNELNIDIRNDGGFVIAPPTKYKLLNGNEVEYKIINNTQIRQIDNNYYQYLIDNGYVKNKFIEPKKEENAIEGFGVINNIKDNNKMDKDFKMNAYYEEILNCLSISRCDNYKDWFQIGCILKNEGHSSSVFHNFSSKSSKYDAKKCEKQWEDCNYERLNFGTLISYAQIDNKDMYEKLYNEKFEEYKKNKRIEKEQKAEQKKEELKKNTEDVYKNELYIKQRKEFEEEHGAFKLENPMSYCVFDKYNNELVQYNERNIIKYCEDKFDKIYINEKVEKSFIKVWFEDKEKTRFKKLIFDPVIKKDEKNFNQFKGFQYDKIDANIEGLKDEDFAFFKLLKHLSPNKNNEDVEYKFTKSWFSHILKSPEKKTNCAIVLYSKLEGVGKNKLIDTFIKLIDNYYGLIKQIEDIKKDFNMDLCNKFLIYGDEITANAKLLVDRIKDSITASKIKMEKKGFDAITLRDYSNWIFTTNNENCFKISPEDRRFFMFHCNEEKETDAFYSQVEEEMNNPEIMCKLYKYLKNYNDKNEYKIGSGIIPKTDYKKELIMADKPAYIQMFYKKPDLFTNRECKSADLFKESQIYAKNNYLSSNYSIKIFGLYMNKIFDNYKKRKNTGIEYNLPDIEEYQKILYEADPDYYKYINGFDKNDNLFLDEKIEKPVEEQKE
jgi:hypothetical protein